MIKLVRTKGETEKGFTLLEYCAGAAVIAGVIWGAMNAFGTEMQGFLNKLATWASERTADVVTTSK